MGMFLMPLIFTEKREESVVGRFFVSIQQSDSHSYDCLSQYDVRSVRNL